jgi:hypothetical protein
MAGVNVSLARSGDAEGGRYLLYVSPRGGSPFSRKLAAVDDDAAKKEAGDILAKEFGLPASLASVEIEPVSGNGSMTA